MKLISINEQKNLNGYLVISTVYERDNTVKPYVFKATQGSSPRFYKTLDAAMKAFNDFIEITSH